MRRQSVLIILSIFIFSLASMAQNIARAENYFQKRDFESALKYYRKAVENKENGYRSVYKNVVLCYTGCGNYQGAINYLSNCLGNSPSMIDSANIYCLYAQCYFELHNQRKAVQYMRLARHISPVVVIPKECRFIEQGYEYITTIGIEDIYYNPGKIVHKKDIVRVSVKHYWDGSTIMPDDKVKLNALANNNIERYWKEWRRYVGEIDAERYGTVYSIWHLEFNCNKEEYRLLKVVEYDKNNNILRSQNYEEADGTLNAGIWKPIVKRSSVEEVFHKVCR